MKLLKPQLTVIAILFSSTLNAGERTSDKTRRWNDNTGTFNVRAVLVNVDDQAVALRLPDGDTITVPVRRLSIGDQQYVNSWSDRAKPESVTPESVKPESVKLAGVNWFADLDDAKQAARGSQGTSDDKPIMCFRVLGELGGFM